MKYELKTLEEYTDEALIAELRRVADSLRGQRLTRERFDSVARVHSSTLHNRFGSWTAALDKAGISEAIAPRYKVLTRDALLQALRAFSAENPRTSLTRDAFAELLDIDANNLTRRFGKWEKLLAEVGLEPVPMGRRYSDDECFENILALWTHYGRQPHFAELKRPPSTVGAKAYVRRWGGWRAALSAFVRRVNDTASSNGEPKVPEVTVDVRNAASTVTPRSIGLALRYKILSRDKFRCVACGASPAKDIGVELHVDHIIPWSRGGENIETNLRTLCSKCNLGKGTTIENAQRLAADAPEAERR